MENSESAFDNRFTRAFGFPLERIAAKIKPHLSEQIKAFIAESPFIVMATSAPDGRCDASPKGGKPGFVRVLDDTHLLVPDVAGNRLFDSYLNMDRNAHVGLIFFIPGLSEAVRVNGRVTIITKDELEQRRIERSVYNVDVERDLLQGIIVEVEEAYGHCPRAMNYSDLWNTDTIEDRHRSGAHPLRSGVTTASPS